jgi:crotonobetainyl-CoA:carnitine CoA-transferase CaiB-like acyl-CoA transferase
MDRMMPNASTNKSFEPIAAKSGAEWQALFDGKEICCCVATSLEDAISDPHFVARGVFGGKLAAADREIHALPVPIAPQFRAQSQTAGYPALGEGNAELLSARSTAETRK